MAHIVQSHHIRSVVLSVVLCAALAPGNAGAATLRMVVQSHPNLGGKCIDVFNHQLLPGMRLQMSDCNNGPAQIFAYDDMIQQFTVGNLCVESGGQSHPQDPVGLNSCDNGIKQRWRVMAAGGYYQIIGVDGGLCLDIRSGDKDNGATLQVAPCSTIAPQQLWALLEAPPAATLAAPGAAPAAAASAPAAPPPAATAPTPAAPPPAAAASAPAAAPPAASLSPPGAAQASGRVMPDDCNQNLNRCSLQIWGRNTFPHTGYTQSVKFSNGMILTCTSNGPNTPRSCTLK